MTDLPKKRRPMEESDAAAGMAKFVAGLPAQRDLAAETREQLAYLLRAELVCCDIYAKINAPLNILKPKGPYALYREKRAERDVLERRARADGSYHAICYHGEWAAQICLHGDLPSFPLIYTDRLNEGEWVEELVQPGPVRIKTVHPDADQPRWLKGLFAGEDR